MRTLTVHSKRVMAMALTVTMAVSGMTVFAPAGEAEAAEQEREDNTVVYFVDCGDIDPTTVPDDGQLGTRNSVTDQVYGTDAKTGYKWGIDDTVSSPLVNGAAPVSGVTTDWTWPFEQIANADQKSKTVTNRYTKNQFESNIEIRHLDYKFEVDNGTYDVEVGFADPWSCSQSPTLYANLGQPDEALIAKDFAVSTNNGVVSGTVKVTDGELTINARGTGDANKAINMTYITISLSGDEARAKRDAESISLPATTTGNLALPVTGSLAGSKISWTSSKPDVIAADGTVTRPAAGEADAVVTLTATVTNGEAVVKKEFTVTVTAMNSLMGMEHFALSDVLLTSDWTVNAFQKDVDWLVSLDTDKLLAGFRETAAYAAGYSDAERKAFMKNATRYDGGWENSLIGGHTLGHYMTAMAQAYSNANISAADKQKVGDILNEIVTSLKKCQELKGDGYIFGATLPNANFQKNVELQFDNVEKGLANIATQAWVPWYTMHKILTGLVDVYKYTGNLDALAVASDLGEWIYERVHNYTDAQKNTVLGIEYGGMNDALYELYKYTKNEHFVAAAEKFDEISLYKAVAAGTPNVLNNKHANTTIPKFLGALNRYLAVGDETGEQYLQYAEAFWEMVITHHTYITGGNSEDEHFGADDILDAERTNVNNETCNTNNMLKMSKALFEITGEKKYADYYENTLLNAIMPSQNPETGMTMYFQPMATGYQKVFSTAEHSFWCCTGTGMENFTKLNDSIYFKKNGQLVINQYTSSKVTWKEQNLTVEQAADLPYSDEVKITVGQIDAKEALNMSLWLRLPDWLASDAVITIDGTAYAYGTNAGYAVIPADRIKNGTVITVKLPMTVVAYNLPDNENVYAFKYGPVVMSAKLGTAKQGTTSHGVSLSVPSVKAISSDNIGISVTETVAEYMEQIADYAVIAKDAAGELTMKLSGTNVDYTFIPHNKLFGDSYGIYFTFSVDTEGRDSDKVLADKEAQRADDATSDRIQAGYGQYEPGLEEKDSVSVTNDNVYRYAKAGGYFQYDVRITEGAENYLLVTFNKEDDGKPIRITVGDEVLFDKVLDWKNETISNETLAEADQAQYYQVKIPISAKITEKYAKDVTHNNETYKALQIRFAGTAAKDSARVCSWLICMRAYRTENELVDLTFDKGDISAAGKVYTVIIPYTESTLSATFTIADSNGYVTVDGKAIDETQAKSLEVIDGKRYDVKVYAEDFETYESYTIRIQVDYTGLAEDLAKDVVGIFDFEEDSNGAEAVSKGAVPPVKDKVEFNYVEGVNGKALQLDGTYGLKLGPTQDLGDSYTISFWMKPDALGGQYDPTFTAGTFAPEYWLNATFDGKIWSSNGSHVEYPASGPYTAGEWQQVTIVVDGTADGSVSGTCIGKLYVNGELVAEGNVAKGIMTRENALAYFGVNAWDAYYKGAVDEILMFGKALNGNEVKAIASNVINVKALQGGGTDEPGTDEPGTDEPGTDKPDTEKPTDKPAGEPSDDKPAGPGGDGNDSANPPKTSDDNAMLFWMFVLAGAAGLLGIAYSAKKKTEE